MKNTINYPYGTQTITRQDIIAVTDALRSPFLTQGPRIGQFEKEICRYTGAKYAVAVSSATAGLHLACLIAGVKRGDEGITSPMSFVASANCILYCGGTVKFADIDRNTGLIDPEEIQKQMTKKTKVIIPVHYAGQSSDMEKIRSIAGKDITIIEDAAHAIGSEYKHTKVGSCKYSDMTVFSFHPVKTITTGEGGIITTNNRVMYEKLILLRTHGITKLSNNLEYSSHKNEPWYYEMQLLGFNYRMTDIQAALGVSQLKRFLRVARRREKIVAEYDKVFSDNPLVKPLRHVGYGKSCRHLYVLLVDFSALRTTRQNVISLLARKGIGTQVHYIPVHYQPYYAKVFGYKKGDFPEAEVFYKQCLTIPLYPALTDADVHTIVKSIQDVLSP